MRNHAKEYQYIDNVLNSKKKTSPFFSEGFFRGLHNQQIDTGKGQIRAQNCFMSDKFLPFVACPALPVAALPCLAPSLPLRCPLLPFVALPCPMLPFVVSLPSLLPCLRFVALPSLRCLRFVVPCLAFASLPSLLPFVAALPSLRFVAIQMIAYAK